MIRLIFSGIVTWMTLAAAFAHAQTTPICPTSPDIRLTTWPPVPVRPISSSETIAFAMRQLYAGPGVDWDFVLENPLISGFQITGDAPGMIAPRGFIAIPYRITLFGPIPAGNYTITVRPIATNVTPNVVCPSLTIPLAVAQGFVNVPVPTINGKLAALLAALLMFTAVLALRRPKRPA